MPTKTVIVIRINDHFLGRHFVAGERPALHSLEKTAVWAYRWANESVARQCAQHLAQTECRGMAVAVERFAIFEDGDFEKAE